MLTIRFAHADLANVRFAISPLVELWQSIRALQSPAARTLHWPWLTEARGRLGGLDLSLLYALQPLTGCAPDFIHPPPTAPVTNLEDELAQVQATPHDRIERELRLAYGDTGLPWELRPFVKRPDQGLSELVELARDYWQRALAPHWVRVRAVLDSDVGYRARCGANGGTQALFASIDESIRYADSLLELDKPWTRLIEPSGRGLLFVPSVFGTTLTVIYGAPWQPTVIYPARGTALLWEPTEPSPRALAALIGNSRALVLAALDCPRSTTELARRLDLSPGGVSQHLSVLRHAGLINRQRVGRIVLYGRPAVGDLLISNHGSDSSHAASVSTHGRLPVTVEPAS